MLRIVLFLLFVILVVAVVLILKTVYDKSEDNDKPEESKDELDMVVSSWETSDRKN